VVIKVQLPSTGDSARVCPPSRHGRPKTTAKHGGTIPLPASNSSQPRQKETERLEASTASSCCGFPTRDFYHITFPRLIGITIRFVHLILQTSAKWPGCIRRTPSRSGKIQQKPSNPPGLSSSSSAVVLRPNQSLRPYTSRRCQSQTTTSNQSLQEPTMSTTMMKRGPRGTTMRYPRIITKNWMRMLMHSLSHATDWCPSRQNTHQRPESIVNESIIKRE